jgi:RHS repeat-associated protein
MASSNCISRIIVICILFFFCQHHLLFARTDPADLLIKLNNEIAVVTDQEQFELKQFLIDPLKTINGTHLNLVPGEEVDIFNGSLKLTAIDFSTPIAPGLNLEVNRVYNSNLYKYFRSVQFDTVSNYDLNLSGWNIGTTYLLERDQQFCDLIQDPCDLIVIYANGTIDSLSRIDAKSKQWLSKSGSIFDHEHNILIDRKGFKYFFNNPVHYHGGVKYYLNRTETPDGKHWLQYSYKNNYLAKISSSDPNKTIDINLSAINYDKDINGNTWEPTSISFNHQKIINYEYKYFNKNPSSGLMALSKVIKANGENVSYNYNFYALNEKNSSYPTAIEQLFLSNIYYSNGEQHDYIYYEDLINLDFNNFKSYRLGSITHNTNKKFNQDETKNSWFIVPLSDGFYNGYKSKTIAVKGDYYSAVTIFNNEQFNSLENPAVPFEYKIYKDININDENLLQKEIYTWFTDKSAHNHITLSSLLLGSKITTRYYNNGQDIYKLEVSDYDEYANAKRIILTSYDGSYKEITQSFQNNIDRNILGLRLNLTVNGNKLLQNNYDDYGNLMISTKQGVMHKYLYRDGLLYAKIDGLNNTTFYKNYNGITPQLIEYPDNTKLLTVMNADGTVASITNARGYTTHYEYNGNKDLIKINPPIGAGTKYNFNYNDYDKYIILDNYIRHEEYNHAGLLISSTENNDKKYIIQYDGLGRKIFESYPFLQTANNADLTAGYYYKYDSLNRIIEKCTPNIYSNCINYNYSVNNTVEIIAPNNEYKLITYKSYGMPEHGQPIIIQQEYNITTIVRDYLDAPIMVKQSDLHDTGVMSKYYEYDSNHKLVKYSDPETGTTEYRYNKLGNLIKKIRNYNNKIIYNYHNKNHRLLNIIYSDFSHNEYFNYDANGNLVKSNKGNITKYYQYDARDRLINEHIDIYNKYATKLKVSYEYNSKGDLSAIIYPDAMRLDLLPNEYGNPTKLGDYVNNIKYHANDFWRSFVFGNGVQAVSELDDLNRINYYKYGSLSLNYLYDSNNNLLNLQLLDHKHTYYDYNINLNYDLAGRLVNARGPWGITTYNYDQYNNIISVKNSQNKTINYSYNHKLHLRSINNNMDYIGYDAFGNMNKYGEHNYAYGLDGNLINVNGTHVSIYEYDTENHRIVRHNNNVIYSNEIITFYNAAGEALYEYNVKYKRVIKYIYLNGVRVAKIEKYLRDDSLGPNGEQSAKPKINYFYNDSNGSHLAGADEHGKILWYQLYEPFGATYFTKINRKDNKHWFVGKEFDNTNLYYFGERYYNDSIARFMSPDPKGVLPEEPNTFNRYNYVNNPYKYKL